MQDVEDDEDEDSDDEEAGDDGAEGDGGAHCKAADLPQPGPHRATIHSHDVDVLKRSVRSAAALPL
jgi:hypothetical protein